MVNISKFFFKFKKSDVKSRDGFTLVELLITIAIIGILASVVFAGLSESRKKARDSRRISEVKDIGLAAEKYFQDHINDATFNGFPDDLGDLDSYFEGNYTKDPQDADYQYIKRDSPSRAYCVGAFLETSSLQTCTCDNDLSLTGVNYCIQGP